MTSSLFACGEAADHTFRLRRLSVVAKAFDSVQESDLRRGSPHPEDSPSFLTIFAQRAITHSISIPEVRYWVFPVLLKETLSENFCGIVSSARRLGASTLAQAQTAASYENNQKPVYRVDVVSRTTRAVSYRHRSGATKINFQGTDLMPAAAGEAKVESKRGRLEIEVEFSGLDRPTSFGNEYLTYVLWAISPEGRPVNIGEVLVGDAGGKMRQTNARRVRCLNKSASGNHSGQTDPHPPAADGRKSLLVA